MKKVLVFMVIIIFIGAVGYKVKKKIDARVEVQPSFSGRNRLVSTQVVKVWRIKAEELRESLILVGDITTYSETLIQPRISGRLLELPVNEGDEVKAGSLLAVIDDQTIRLQLQQGESNLAVIRANLNQAELKVAQAAAEKERYKELLKHRYISQIEYDNVENSYMAALTSREILKEQLLSAEKNQELLQLQLDQTKVYAPLDGYVLAKHVTAGMNVTTGTNLLTVAPLSPVRLKFNIDQKAASGIRKRTPVTFVTDALPGQVFTGQITQAAPTYDPTTRTMSFSVDLPNDRRRLEPGMFGTVEVILTSDKWALAFPQEALVSVGGENGVFVVDAEMTARFKPVVTGMIVNNMIEAVSGVEEGDQVVVVGQNNLREGQKVEVLSTEGLLSPETGGRSGGGNGINQRFLQGERGRQ